MAQTDIVGWRPDFAQTRDTQKAMRWLSETPRLFANNPVRGRHMPTGGLFFFTLSVLLNISFVSHLLPSIFKASAYFNLPASTICSTLHFLSLVA
jgi:hypothetical protein